MCGRYTLVAGVKDLIAIFQLPPEELSFYESRHNIAPTQPIPVIHDQKAEHMLRGFIPAWRSYPCSFLSLNLRIQAR